MTETAGDRVLREFDESVRAIVRDEIASLAGKALRRTQDQDFTRSPERNMMVEIANREMAQFWAEVLAEYGQQDTASVTASDLSPEMLAQAAKLLGVTEQELLNDPGCLSDLPPEDAAELVGGDVIEDKEGNAVGFTFPKGPE